VDDIIVTGNNSKLIHSLVSQMNSVFSLKNLDELDYFLGIEVQRQQDGSLILTQSKYIRDILTKTNMDESNPILSPMVGGCKLTKFGFEDSSDPTLYRSIVVALQYATITRPENSFSVNKVCQFMAKPSDQHWLAVKRILRYLKGTVSLGLHFQTASLQQPFPLHAYCDADWASDPDDSVKKSHIACLSSWGATYISVGQLHLMSIGFKLKSSMVSEPIAHLSSCLV